MHDSWFGMLINLWMHLGSWISTVPLGYHLKPFPPRGSPLTGMVLAGLGEKRLSNSYPFFMLSQLSARIHNSLGHTKPWTISEFSGTEPMLSDKIYSLMRTHMFNHTRTHQWSSEHWGFNPHLWLVNTKPGYHLKSHKCKLAGLHKQPDTLVLS